MHIHHGLPVCKLHFQKAFVPQNAGVVDHYVKPAKGLHGRFNYIFTAFGCGHIIIVGQRFPAKLPDLSHNQIRRSAGSLAGPVTGASQIVDHDPGAALGQFQGIDPAESCAGTGHNCDLAIKAYLVPIRRGSGHRYRFPEIIDKTAFLVHTLGFEFHLHRQTDTDIVQFTIRKIGDEAPAAFKLNHPVYGRRVNRNRQHVAGKGFNLAR